jgi:hypothetical protein
VGKIYTLEAWDKVSPSRDFAGELIEILVASVTNEQTNQSTNQPNN